MTPGAKPVEQRRIRVLLVDDSPIAIEVIRRMLSIAPEIHIVGAAGNGAEALELIPSLRPDVVCTDLHMPTMDGLRLTREVMAHHPLPILVMSTSLQPDQTANIFAMLEAGAVDILAKPRGGLESDFGVIAHDLIRKIRILSGVKVVRRRAASNPSTDVAPASVSTPKPASRPRIVGIGSSTGGPQALEAILGALPREFPLPLMCIQHIAPGFMQGLVTWLGNCCRIGVRTAAAGEAPQPGVAYFAQDSRHLELDECGLFRCSSSGPLDGHRPSVDLAFTSIARCHGPSALGVLLTGMGRDGAQGLLDIERAGGFAIAQDEQSSIVFGMPKAAIQLGVKPLVLSIEQIAPTLMRIAANGTSAGAGHG